MSGEAQKPETPEKPQEPQWCAYHPGVEAVAKCDLCGKPVCENCFIDLAGKKACPDCKPAIIGEFITGETAQPVRKRIWKPFRIGRNVIKRLREQRHDRFFKDLPVPEYESVKPEKPDPKELYKQWLRETAKESTIGEEIFWVGVLSLVLILAVPIVWLLYLKYRRDVKKAFIKPDRKAVIGLILSFVPLIYPVLLIYIACCV